MSRETELAYLSIAEAGALFRSRKLSPVELVDALFARGERLQSSLAAYVTMTPDIARAEAKRAEAAFMHGGREAASPLLGIPVAYKDNLATRGVRTTAGSELLLDWVPDYDAGPVEKLRAAGAVMMGKVATNELACAIQQPTHSLKAPRNPWNTAHTPGGSSSGSGAALAAGMILGSVGTDTGGSIRLPSACSGTTGLKPTFGLVSRYGVVPLSWSLDHAGPMARTAADVAALLTALIGYDPRDPVSVNARPQDYTVGIDGGIRGLRVAIPTNFFLEGVGDEARKALYATADVLRGLGATVEEITIPRGELVEVYWIIFQAEAYAYFKDDLTRHPEKFAPWIKSRIESGALYQASEYLKAQSARALLKEEYGKVMSRYDLVLTPAQPGDAPKYEDATALGFNRYRLYPSAFNMTGQPSLAVPAGFSSRGLPLGVLLSARPFEEALLLRAAHAYQGVTDWHKRHPNI